MKPSYTIKAEDSHLVLEAEVKAWASGGGYISAPGEWVGKKVKVVLVDES